MNLSWKIFTAFRIPVRLHFTMVVIPFLAFSWVDTTGPDALIVAAVLTVLLFGSVLLHEFGHALTGRRYGVHTEDIVLTPIGGMARMHNIPQRPSAEIAIAIAGPLVSFALAGVAFGLAVGFSMLPVYHPLAIEMFKVLFHLNLALGTFNLVPALPMDGGRVFRGLLALKFSHLKATTIASRVGKVLAIGGGVWGVYSGNWSLALIAVFIYSAAGQEERIAVMREAARRAREEGGPFGASPFGGMPFGGMPFGGQAPFGNRGHYVYREASGRPPESSDEWVDGDTSANAKVVEGGKVVILSRKDSR